MTRVWILFLMILIKYTNGQSVRKSSFTLVIDVTRSMEKVRKHVEEYAHAIFDAAVDSNESYIEKFILVTFADTTKYNTNVINVTETTERDEFKNCLSLTLVRGGDCPEQCLSGLQTGIEKSLPGSIVYVFTDASAKDYDMYKTVMDRAVKKEIQVVFILTGKCNPVKHGTKGYDIYEDIARDTSGQVFNLYDDQIGDILKYIISSLKTKRITLVAKSFPAGKYKIIYTPDHATSDTMISISCLNVIDMMPNITGPDNEKLAINKIVDLQNVTVIKVNETKIGNHTVTMDCKTNSRVMVTAKSHLQFRHGFSAFTPTSLNDTTIKPLSDDKTYLTIMAIGIFLPQAVRLLDEHDNLLPDYIMPLTALNETENLFITEPLDAPKMMFRIAVAGIDLEHNETIIRIGTTWVEPQNASLETPNPKKPTISIERGPKITVEVNTTLQLKCLVSAYPKPTNITWEHSGKVLETAVFDFDLPYDYVSVHKINKVHRNATYECKAKNSEGDDTQSIIVETKPKVIEKPTELPIIDKKSISHDFIEGTSSANISCRVTNGTPKPTVQWYYNDTVSGVFVEINDAKDKENLTLTNVKKKDGGSYKCVATNLMGSDTMEVTIVVEYAPKILSKDSKPTTVIAGSEVTLTCLADGVPEPLVNWSKDDKPLIGTKFVSSSDYRLIFKADLEDSGSYECHASNKFGFDNKTSLVEVQKSPTLLIQESDPIDTEYGDPLNMTCEVWGYPKPDIKWINIDTNEELETKTEEKVTYHFVSYLSIDNITKNATYRCKANNTLGFDEKDVSVRTERKPFFDVLSSPIDTTYNVTYKSMAQFNCKVDAYPPADVNWFKNGKVLSKDDISVSSDGFVLTVKDMQPIDAGKFMCEAKNIHHTYKYPFKIQITGVVAPEISLKSKRSHVPENSDTKLNCRVKNGIPKPTVQWYYNDTVSGVYVEINDAKDKENLTLTNVNRKDGRSYKCVATNFMGNDTMEVTLVVEYAPKILSNDSKPTTVIAGAEVTLTCLADGVPEPLVNWSKDDKPLIGTKFVSSSDYRLIFKADLEDSGSYECHASNKFGFDNKTSLVEVQKSPTLLIQESDPIDTEYGDPLNMTCEVWGYPKPDIKWINIDTNEELETKIEEKVAYHFVSYLSIDKITKNTTYRCKANNTLGFDEKDVSVRTERKPFFDVLSSPIDTTYNVTYKSMAQFNCKVDAYPPADVNWFKNGKVLSKDDVSVSSDGFVLTVKDMQPIDAGKFMCEAKNIHHTYQYPFEIQITGLVKPKIRKNINIRVPENSITKISCQIEKGIPIPTIEWYYKNTDSSSFVELKKNLNQEEFILKVTKRKDRGTYKCLAINVAGIAEMEVDLTVDYAPTLDSVSEIRTAMAGSYVKLLCVTDGNPEPIVIWTKNDSPLTDLKFIISGDHSLVFSVDVDDRGVYKCSASNKLGIANKTVTIEVEKPPTVFVDGDSKQQVYLDDALDLKCNVHGYPTPDIRWKDTNNRLLLTGSTSVVKLPYEYLSILHIDNVNKNATYKCEAKNTHGQNYASVLVEAVRQKHLDIIKKPKDTTIPYNTKGNLYCKVDAYPPARISWHKGFQRVRNKNGVKISSDGSTLTLENMQLDQVGRYICTANNSHFIKHSIAIVTISGLVAPIIKNDQNAYEVKEGQEVRITCSVTGIPKPTVKWTKVGSKASFSTTADNIFIRNTNLYDSGTYTCTAVNAIGKDTKNVTLEVYGILRVDEYDDLELKCVNKSYRKANFVWHYKGTADNPKIPPEILQSVNMLEIENIKTNQRGRYTCYASNLKGGSATVSYEVDVLTAVVIHNPDKYIRGVVGDKKLSIYCNATGHPAPNYFEWIINGALITSETGNTLTLRNVSKKYNQNTITCTANNDNDKRDSSSYTVIVDDYPSLNNPNYTKNMKLGDTDFVICPVSHKNGADLRWYKDNTKILDGELYIKSAKSFDAGLYTCRVSDSDKSESANIQLHVKSTSIFFRNTAVKTTLSLGFGDIANLDCVAFGTPFPMVSWSYNGRIIFSPTFYHSLHSITINQANVGKYKCEVTNTFDSISRVFDVSLDECVVKIDPDEHNKPLIITQHFSWPSYKYDTGFLYIPKNQSLLFACTSPINRSNYTYLPAYCNKRDGVTQLEIYTKPYKYSDLHCAQEVRPQVKWTGISCYGEDSETVKIVYEIVGTKIEVYDVCMNLDYNIPFYTKHLQHNMPVKAVPNSVTWFHDRLKYDFGKVYGLREQTQTLQSILGDPWHRHDGCIFSKRQLVNPLDIFPGVPQKATFTHLNVVPHWSRCSSRNWDEVESRVRLLAQSTSNGLTVWTGTTEILKLKDNYGIMQEIVISDLTSSTLQVYTYLWKVVQNPKKRLSLAIIQLNIPDITLSEARKYVRCKDICQGINWMRGHQWDDVSNGYTFCCRLREFEDKFGYGGFEIFGRGMTNPLQR